MPHVLHWLPLLLLWMSIHPASAADVRVAVSYFDDASGDSDLAPLSHGLAQMLITDLSVAEGFVVVERARLDAVLAEIELQQSAWADPATAVTLGKGMGADLMLTGSYVVQGQTLRVDARVIDVQSAEVVLSVKSLGASADFLEIERDLAMRLIEGLGAELSILSKTRIGKGSTADVVALSHYSTGLARSDAGDATGAFEAFSEATKRDPAFQIATDEMERVRALLDATNEALDERSRARLAEWTARNQCACAYAPDPDGTRQPLDTLSPGERAGRRLMYGGQAGLFSEVSASPHYVVAVQLVQAGLFEEADALLDGLESPDFVDAVPATWSAPDPHLAKLGVVQPNTFRFWDESMFSGAGLDRDAMVRAHHCAVHQVRSYRFYRDAELERAMTEQRSAAAIPTPDERSRQRLGHCMDGEVWSAAPVEFQGALRAVIDRAASDPQTRKALSMERDLLRDRASTVRAELKQEADALQCESLCPWP